MRPAARKAHLTARPLPFAEPERQRKPQRQYTQEFCLGENELWNAVSRASDDPVDHRALESGNGGGAGGR